MSCSNGVKVLHPKVIFATEPSQIISLEDSLVAPILYKKLPNLNDMPVDEAKQKFIAAILPAILIAKHHLKEKKEHLELLQLKQPWSAQDSTFYKKLAHKYKAKDIEQLVFRMHTHPNSIVLAQAAIESGWGSSRFFRKANNLFGVWSYHANEPRIAASKNDVYLRKYEDISQSIEDYFATIGRTRAYHQFRLKRTSTSDIDQLLPLLKHYSERGLSYINQLHTVIRQNDLTQYDHYKIDPRYLIEPS